ncbi:hypothetical protein JEV46_22920 [Pseudomonas aeruginosa]|uniref:hypothetical protein n=1 Tax=Pseudomonas aeruginosa TaxID=287 RepID=UPI000E31CEC6|nr:hypothetical protein [Pseudomonas aeruginosa]MBI7390000.1 hypothetical protein [Pseudomonas aeruginosa]NPZ67053.1 hypothetical protein [Pseudomonas aeruginosa]
MTATPNTTRKPSTQKQRTCKAKGCSKRFTVKPSHPGKLYCSATCKDSVKVRKVSAERAKEREQKRLDNAHKSAFFHFLAAECKRAGTLEILHNHDVDSLMALHYVYSDRLRFNRFGAVRTFDLCHIYPVAGERLGLLRADNLVIAPAALNKAHGNRHFGSGVSIDRASLKKSLRVSKDAASSEITERIVKYLGKAVVAEFSALANLQPTQRFKNVLFLQQHWEALVEIKPEMKSHSDLDKLSSVVISGLVAQVKGKPGFKPSADVVRVIDVLHGECERLQAYSPELAALTKALAEVAEDDVIDLGRGMVTTQAKNVPSSAIKAVFDALHGAEVAFAVKALKAVSSRDYAQAHKDDWDLWEELDMVA